jgi:integrase
MRWRLPRPRQLADFYHGSWRSWPARGWDYGLFVVSDACEGSFKSPQCLSKEWSQLAGVLCLVGTQGRRPTFHDLRHTFATIAAVSSVDIKTVSVLLGTRTRR